MRAHAHTQAPKHTHTHTHTHTLSHTLTPAHNPGLSALPAAIQIMLGWTLLSKTELAGPMGRFKPLEREGVIMSVQRSASGGSGLAGLL